VSRLTSTEPAIAPVQAPTIVEDPEVVPIEDDGDHDRFAHIIRKDDQMKGYVMGEPVVALCGKVWIPSRDPEKYPLCPTCRDILAQLRS
jgi:hypothetical protein